MLEGLVELVESPKHTKDGAELCSQLYNRNGLWELGEGVPVCNLATRLPYLFLVLPIHVVILLVLYYCAEFSNK